MEHRQKKRYIKRLGLAVVGICWGLAGCKAGELVEAEILIEAEKQAEIQDVRIDKQVVERLVLPPVDGDRLWATLEPLVGQRYWSQERASARQQITASLVALGWEVEEQVFEQGRNLIATYPIPSEPTAAAEGSQVLVGAHYDTVQGSPGADDNATGVAVLLELAALYSEQLHGKQPPLHPDSAVSQAPIFTPQQGLTLVFFDQEEQGLLGSLAFTAELGNLESIHSVVVLDMLGASCGEPGCQKYPAFLDRMVEGQRLSDRGDFIAVVGEAERPGLLSAFGVDDERDRSDGSNRTEDQALPQVLRVPVPFKGLLTPDVLRSDHAPFWLNGIGAVLVTDTANLRSPHYHQPSDDLSQVDRVFFQGVAQQVVNGVWRLLAQSSAQPRVQGPGELPERPSA